MNRRELFKSAVLGAGAAAAAGAQQAREHIHVHSIAPAQAAAAGETWQPQVLDAHQNETVIQLTELVIPETDTPGAKAAEVNRFIDLYLSDLAEDHGHAFVQGLGWLDGYALAQHNQPFIALDEAQQAAILERLEGAEDPDLEPGTRFFGELKRLTVQGYYTSKIGIAELNKDGVPDTFACTHESHA